MRTRRWIRALVVAAVPALTLVAAVPAARAQTAGQDAASRTPSPAEVKRASDHFEKGSKLFDAKKYALALDEFRKSYAVVASPNSHLYIARCLANLGEPREAYLEFDQVVAEADARVAAGEAKYAPTRDTARTERDEVAGKIALVTVTVNRAEPTTTLKVGGAEVPRDRWGKPVPIAPGDVDVTVETPGQPPASQKLSVAAGDKKDVSLDAVRAVAPPTEVAPVSAPSNPAPTWMRPAAFAAGGVGAAGLVVFAIAGIMTNSTYSDLEEQCKGACPEGQRFEDDISSGQTTQTLANVGLIVGAVGVAAGVTLFVLSMDSAGAGAGRDAKAAPPGAGRAGPSARVVAAPSYVGVHGSF